MDYLYFAIGINPKSLAGYQFKEQQADSQLKYTPAKN